MNKKSNSKGFYYLLIALLIVLVFFSFTSVNTSGVKITYKQAIEYFQEDKVDGWYLVGTSKIVFDLTEDVVEKNNVTSENFPKKSDAYIVYNSEEYKYLLQNYQFRQGDETKDVIYLDSEQATGSILDWLPTILFLTFGGILLFVLIKSFSSKGNGTMGFGKSRARAVSNIKVRFSDIAGADEEKEELKEIVEFLKNPKKFTELGARIPKGVLLVGPPGTGKTLLARAVAGESNVPFLSISGSDFVEMFVGVGASRVRDLFEQANKTKPCIIFIDEIDAVGRQRGAGLGGSNDEREQTLNQMLVELDGFEANQGIIVLAATNRVDVLDPALLRPGRFDRQIYVHEPDVKGREGIIRIHAKNKPLADDVDFNVLARITSGFTGADLENMLNEAAILAARANRPRIIMEDITEGINKVIMGPQKKSRLVTERDKKITAYHEAGHAILDKRLKYAQEVQEVSIIQRGNAAGYTMVRPENDDNHVTVNFLNDEIASFMGGRITEELVFKDFTTGASNDIQRATQLARRMVTEWGMSAKFGFMSFESNQQVFIGRDYQNKNLYSEKTASEIDEEIQAILEYNYKRAKKIIQENMSYIDQIVDLLLEKETIYKNEIDMILDGKSNEEIISEMDKREKKRLAREKKEKQLKAQQEKIKELEVKLKTSEIFLKHGLISEEDYKEVVDLRNKYNQTALDAGKKTTSKAKTENKQKTTKKDASKTEKPQDKKENTDTKKDNE